MIVFEVGKIIGGGKHSNMFASYRVPNILHLGGGGGPGSSGVLYILVQLLMGLFFLYNVYISVGDWMNTAFPLLSRAFSLLFFFFF